MTNGNEGIMPAPGYDNGYGVTVGATDGLTKREYFAARAMQGLLSNAGLVEGNWTEDLQTFSIRLADRLIAALNATEGEGK